MNEEDAFELFSKWYEQCLESGLEPEKIVSKMGGMVLITDEDLIDKLRDGGIISDE
jgi:hypothetical protein